MKNIILIAKREFFTQVKKKSFIILTLLTPLLIIVFGGVVSLMFQANETQMQISVIDKSGLFKDRLKSDQNIRYVFSSEETEKSLIKALETTEEMNGVMIIPKKEIHELENSIEILTNKNLSNEARRNIAGNISEIIKAEKINALGISTVQIEDLNKGVNLHVVNVLEKEKKQDSFLVGVKSGLSMFLMYCVFTFIMMYGIRVMRSVLEEKNNRVVEILISSVKPFELMMGKILGVTGVALVQFGRLRFLRVSFIATYALLAAYAILVVLSPVNLGLNPIIATAITSLYTVTRWEPDRRWGTAALLLALAGALVNPVTLASYTPPYESDADPTTGSGWDGTILLVRALSSLVFVGAVVLTYLLASSRRRIAENQALDVGIAAAQAVAAERLSLARELHDLVGHSLTTIKVQAATGLALGGEERLRSTLTTVRDTADASLASVRQLVSVLRSDAGEITPLADLRTIPALIETTRSSGSRISAVLPEPEVLERCNSAWSAIQRLTLVRLVGETLTNAVRHGTGQIELSLTLSQDSCHLHVANPVPDVAEHSPFGGSGLVGLEERLRLVGGTMTHGVHNNGDHSFFTIDVDFPVAPLELPASAMTAGETESGDCR